MVANWQTGSIAGFPIGRHGELGESTAFSQHEGVRSGPPAPGEPQVHCHSVVVTPDNRFLLATDTGLNRVYVYRLDPSKAMFTPHDPPFLGLQKPTNPRHLALHPNAKWAYVSNEINPGGCTLLRFNPARGTLEEGPVAASVPRITRADVPGRMRRPSLGQLRLRIESRAQFDRRFPGRSGSGNADDGGGIRAGR